MKKSTGILILSGLAALYFLKHKKQEGVIEPDHGEYNVKVFRYKDLGNGLYYIDKVLYNGLHRANKVSKEEFDETLAFYRAKGVTIIDLLQEY